MKKIVICAGHIFSRSFECRLCNEAAPVSWLSRGGLREKNGFSLPHTVNRPHLNNKTKVHKEN